MKFYSDEELLKAAVMPLLSWYQDHSRILPWREDPSPYGTWVSEIMLQQTRVEAVIDYYFRFMERFPDIVTLAKATEDEVFTLWQGLGYYRRGAMLRKAAQEVCEKYDGVLPGDHEALLSLPGIGKYTAGAIASIGFALPYPAVDGNVLRVVSRLLASKENVSDEKVKRKMEALLSDVIPKDAPGDFNQSLMELGALVCIPNGTPKCDQCPVNLFCRGMEMGIAQSLPIKEKKKPRRIEERRVYLLRCGEEIAIQKRGDKGLLAKMWEYPNVLGYGTIAEVEEEFPLGQIKNVGKAKHVFTHIEWHMEWYEIVLPQKMYYENCIWVKEYELENYALASAFKKLK